MTLREPNLVAIAGDWHGDTFWAKRMIEIAAFNGCQAIVHTGDFGFDFTSNFVRALRYTLDDHDIDLLFIRGNHDNPGLLERGWKPDENGFHISPFGGRGAERLRYIPQGHRWNWWGLTWMGLGGAHSVDRQWLTAGWDWWPEELISTHDAYRAVKGGKVNIMITHDLPARAKLPNERKSTGWPAAELVAAEQHRQMLQSVVDEVQPDMLFHGHFHSRFSQMVGQMRVIGLDMNGSSPRANLHIIDAALIERDVREPYPGD